MRMLLRAIFTAILLLSIANGTGDAVANCDGTTCTYLPLISVSPIVKINEERLSRQRTGQYSLSGDAINLSQTPVSNVKITARLYSAQGQLLEAMTTKLSASVLLPGQLSPFWFAFYTTVFDQPNAYAKVIPSDWSTEAGSNYRPIVVAAIDSSIETVTVTLRNEQQQLLYDIRAMVWLRTLYPCASATAMESVASELQPGGTVVFSRTFFIRTYANANSTVGERICSRM